MRIYLLFLVILIGSAGASSAQESEPPRKPVLIRDEVNKEKPEKVYVHDPEAAKENVEIGDFYYRRDNYRAAEERYREAIQYNKKWPESYEKLIDALDEQGEYAEASEICRLFIEENPGSDEISDFKEKLGEMERKLSSQSEAD